MFVDEELTLVFYNLVSEVADTCIADIGDTQRSTSATGGAGCDGSGRLAAADGRAETRPEGVPVLFKGSWCSQP